MMVKWANEGLLQANDCKMLVIMVKWVYDHILISPSLTSISPSLKSISPSLMSILPSLAHLTIIEKLHRLHYLLSFWCFFTRFENRDEAEKLTFLPHILSASFLKKNVILLYYIISVVYFSIKIYIKNITFVKIQKFKYRELSL